MSTLSASQLPLAPLGAGDLIDRAVRLYRRHFFVLIRTAAPPVIIIAAGWILLSITLRQVFVTAETSDLFVYLLLSFLSFGVMLAGYIAILVVMGGATRTLMAHLLRNDPVTAQATYKAVRSRFWGLLVASVIVLLWILGSFIAASSGGQMVGLIFFFVAAALVNLSVWIGGIVGVVGFLLTTAFSLWLFFFIVGRVAYVPQVMLVEGKGVIEAVGRSISLARGNIRRLMAMTLFTTFGTISVVMILSVLIGLLGQLGGVNPLQPAEWPAWYAIAGSVLGPFSAILLIPVWVLGLSLLYVDERVRHEGYDIELMAARQLGEVPDINVTSPLGTALYTERKTPPPAPRSSGNVLNLVLLLFILFICPASATAIPITEYQSNLTKAIDALDTLHDLEEDETTSNYETRFTKTLDGIRIALPKTQTVESGTDVYEVDNTWLHRALDELEKVIDRPQKIEEIVENLRAIDERVTERRDASGTVGSKDLSKAKLESILARPEYAGGAKGPNALTRLLRDFLQWLLKFLPKPKPREPASFWWINLVARLLVVILGVGVVVFVFRTLRSRFKRSGRIKTRKKDEPRIVLGERLEPDQTATDLLSEAEALARRGDLRAAIRKAYIALLVELGDRKLISLAQHKTNRDYLNSVRNVPQLHSNMRGLTDSFERHWYGFVDASQSDWQNFRDGYLAALQTGN